MKLIHKFKFKTIWKDEKIPIISNIHLLRMIVISTLLYGSEKLTLTSTIKRKYMPSKLDNTNIYLRNCSHCSPWCPLTYLLGVGLVLLLHSFRSRATSWVTTTPVMYCFLCWCHVFLGRPRRLVPVIARSITLWVALFASLLWTCPHQRRRSLRITSSIGEMCNMRRISSFRMWSRLDTPRIPRSILVSVLAIFLLLFTFIAQYSPPYVRVGLIMASSIYIIQFLHTDSISLTPPRARHPTLRKLLWRKLVTLMSACSGRNYNFQCINVVFWRVFCARQRARWLRAELT